MVLRHFSAYFETLREIKIKLPISFHAENMAFSIASKSQENSIEQTLNIKDSWQTTSHYYFLLETEKVLDLDQHYLIYDQDRNQTLLTWGGIVRTEVFEHHFYYDKQDLGATYSPEATTFKLWAPISEQVLLKIADKVFTMKKGKSGVWQVKITGDLDGQSYVYLHLVNGNWQETQDPYALSAQANSGQSFVINPEKITTKSHFQNIVPINQAVIYELSIRDFSSQKDVNFKHPKQYLGLIESPEMEGQTLGFDYIKNLGVSHIQLMPVYDFASIDETQPDTVYNWGYDPMLYNVPEGSFSSNPHDPYLRIKELQTVIDTYHEANIGVIMDVVYNHVYDVDRFVLEKIVPGYCSRFDDTGKRTNGTGCGNDMATERLMVRKFIVDSVLTWIKYYGFDGFRFDLMGIIDIDTMLAVEKAARHIYPNIYLYGEGWQMPTGLDTEKLAHQFNSYQMPNIGFFNDQYREEFKKILTQPDRLVQRFKHPMVEENLLASVGLVAEFGRYLNITQSVNYIECHDNATFFDYLTLHAPYLTQEEKEQRASLALQLILLSQGVAFIHSGQEAFRTKDLIDNTYNISDDINRLDWQRILHYQAHSDFISQLIKFRRHEPLLHLSSKEELLDKTSCYWLTPTVLRYTLKDETRLIEIVINFGQDNFDYDNTNQLNLNLKDYQINFETSLELLPERVNIRPMSLIILSQ